MLLLTNLALGYLGYLQLHSTDLALLKKQQWEGLQQEEERLSLELRQSAGSPLAHLSSIQCMEEVMITHL